MPDESRSIAVIGTGVGGLAFAIRVLKEFGEGVDIILYEKDRDIGGTWRDNVYPGCCCDIAAHFYSLSGEPFSDTTLSHPFQHEIHSYWKALCKKYNLLDRIRFGKKVVSACWNSKSAVYSITVEDVDTKGQEQVSARILLSAVGSLHIPNLDGMKGIETFAGKWFHSSKWDSSVDLVGRAESPVRIGVVGNGASATQLIPEISKDAGSHVINFCRTPSWFLPPIRSQYSSIQRFVFDNVPLVYKMHRVQLFLQNELVYGIVFGNSLFRSGLAWVLKKYMLSTAPKGYHQAILPKYELGCKRILFDAGYLNALHRPNLQLNWDGIDSIVPEGVKTLSGDVVPVDVLILSTGFVTDHYPLKVTGKNGQTLEGFYQTKGGPTAYLGTTVPTFPNFFMLQGPNTFTGHTSALFTLETQIDYILQCIRPLLRPKELSVRSMDLKPKPFDQYDEVIQRRANASVFFSCRSYYRSRETGKVTGMFPGSGILFWRWLRKVRWADYEIELVDGTVSDGSALAQSGLTTTVIATAALAVLFGAVYTYAY